MQFGANTFCDGKQVTGTYIWYVNSTVGSSIDEESGLYKAGREVGTDTVKVVDTANENTEATAEVQISLRWPMAYAELWDDGHKEEKLFLLRSFLQNHRRIWLPMLWIYKNGIAHR